MIWKSIISLLCFHTIETIVTAGDSNDRSRLFPLDSLAWHFVVVLVVEVVPSQGAEFNVSSLSVYVGLQVKQMLCAGYL